MSPSLVDDRPEKKPVENPLARFVVVILIFRAPDRSDLK